MEQKVVKTDLSLEELKASSDLRIADRSLSNLETIVFRLPKDVQLELEAEQFVEKHCTSNYESARISHKGGHREYIIRYTGKNIDDTVDVVNYSEGRKIGDIRFNPATPPLHEFSVFDRLRLAKGDLTIASIMPKGQEGAQSFKYDLHYGSCAGFVMSSIINYYEGGNQDGIAIQENLETVNGQLKTVLRFIVSDGVGGERGGDLATEAILQNALAHQSLDKSARRLFMNFARSIRTKINEESMAQEGESVGAAVATLDICEGQSLVRHAGDVKVAQFRNCFCIFDTVDHTLFQDSVNKGANPEAIPKQWRHMLMSSVKCKDGEVEVSKVDQDILEVSTGDIYIAASDGLWDNLTVEEAEEILKELTPEERLNPQVITDKIKDKLYEKLTDPNFKFKIDNIALVVYVQFSEHSDVCLRSQFEDLEINLEDIDTDLD